MRSFSLLFLSIFFWGCGWFGPGPEVRHIRLSDMVVTDTDFRPREFVAEGENMVCPIYYIGPVKDSISVCKRYWVGDTTGSILTKGHCHGRGYYRKSLRIEVDTGDDVNLFIDHFSDDGKTDFDSSNYYHAYLVRIRNISDSVIWMGRTRSMYHLGMERSDKKGHWVKCRSSLAELPLCTSSQPDIFLRPGEMIISKVARYRRIADIEYRLVLGWNEDVVYSNNFF